MKSNKSNGKISFGLQFASQEIVSKYTELTRDIIINIIQIDPGDVILTDESDLFNLAKIEDIISRTIKHFDIILTEDQVSNMKMKDYIELILSKNK